MVREANTELVGLLQNTDDSAQRAITEFVREWVSKIREFDLPLDEAFLDFVHNWNADEDLPQGLNHQRLERLFRAQVQAGIARGEFVPDIPVDRIVSLIIVTLSGFGLYLSTHRKKEDSNEWANEAATLVDDGILRRWLA